MKVLFDNNISPRVAHAIHALVEPHGHIVEALRDKFAPSTKDEDWIPVLGAERGWSVVSGDTRITRSATERAAWRQTDLIGYFLAPGWRKLDPLHQTGRLLFWWDKLIAHSGLVTGGSVHELPINAGSKIKPLPL